MTGKRRTRKTTPAPVPATVQVKVVRRYVGSPPLGETVTVTRTPYLNALIKRGFLKVV